MRLTSVSAEPCSQSAVSASPAPTSSCPSPVPPCIQQKHVSPRCHCQRGFCRCTSLLCCERSPGQVSCQSILSTVCLVSGGASVVVVQMLEGGASYLCFSRALFSVCSSNFSRSHVFCPSPVPPCIRSMSAPDVIVKEASAAAQACCAVNGRQARCRVRAEHSVLGLWRSFRCRCPDVRRRCVLPLFQQSLVLSLQCQLLPLPRLLVLLQSLPAYSRSMSAPDVIVKEASAVAQACCAVNGRQARCRVRAF